jgi:hypothetical protein
MTTKLYPIILFYLLGQCAPRSMMCAHQRAEVHRTGPRAVGDQACAAGPPARPGVHGVRCVHLRAANERLRGCLCLEALRRLLPGTSPLLLHVCQVLLELNALPPGPGDQRTVDVIKSGACLDRSAPASRGMPSGAARSRRPLDLRMPGLRNVGCVARCCGQ